MFIENYCQQTFKHVGFNDTLCHFVFLSQFLYCKFVVSPGSTFTRDYYENVVPVLDSEDVNKQAVAKVCEWNTLKMCVLVYVKTKKCTHGLITRLW